MTVPVALAPPLVAESADALFDVIAIALPFNVPEMAAVAAPVSADWP